MTAALLRKELRSLRPILMLIMALILVDVVDMLISTQARSMHELLASVSEGLPILQILLGFAVGTGLLVREIDDGTLGFLDGLPVTRTTVYIAKVTAAMLVLSVLPAWSLLLNASMHLATRESLDFALHPSLLLIFFALSMLVSAVSLTAGMLLGFLRYLAWLVLVLCAIGIKLLEDSAPAWSAALNTADLLTLRFSGTSWALPLASIGTQLGAALLFGLSTFFLFRCAGRVQARVQRFQQHKRWLVLPAVALMFVAAIGGMVTLAKRSHVEDGTAQAGSNSGARFTPIAAGHASTTHYTFSYPALSSARVSALIARADQTFIDVAALLKMEGGAPIDVDLSGSTTNTEGTAYFNRIRMHVRSDDAIDVLAHETAHVFAIRLAGGEAGRQLDGMMVFNEGLAEWVEGKLRKQAGANAQHELAAAIVSARRLVTPRQLTDHDAFVAAVDANLKYPLGAILIERFVARYGPGAPKALLEALARKDFPRNLSGYRLWQTAFQLAGFDLDLVFDDYARHLRQLEPRFASQIARLPRLRGSLVEQEEGYAVTLRMDLPLPDDAYPAVRFRPGKDASADQYRSSDSELGDNGKYSAYVPDDTISRGEICFQPGLTYAGITIYEPWVCLPVSSAAQESGK